MGAGNNSTMITRRLVPWTQPFSTVQKQIFRLVPQRLWILYGGLRNEEGQEMDLGSRRNRKCADYDQIQTCSFWCVRMGLAAVCTSVHLLQQLPPLLLWLHQRLYRSVGVSSLNCFSIFSLPQNCLYSQQSLPPRAEDISFRPLRGIQIKPPLC